MSAAWSMPRDPALPATTLGVLIRDSLTHGGEQCTWKRRPSVGSLATASADGSVRHACSASGWLRLCVASASALLSHA